MGLILSETEKIVANALSLLCTILQRLSNCLHNSEHRQIRHDPSSSNSKVIPQQDESQKHKSVRASQNNERTATNASSIKTSKPRPNYQQHIEELEKRRVILHNLKREYSRAKADFEKSENTLRCLGRQHRCYHRWRKQKESAERSLGKISRRLQNARIVEREAMVKV